ncbi:uncharacterized protein EAF01_005895 [Botrytis porri]|uniref:2EXR domain-containing protein n=1 Tax=Botrytis porri TaxID=87229 RepID=A0A4Z1L6H7_9HELO|nr:uncharacterized protein EAF01_005895 [Botrytis porri]KAF7905374.1 hypothetical protein EAF01_005895 [Botrytis porri]TGO92318.1 hypothetical protein BPOR_0005g00070 [Botrytis porri]
MSTQVSQSLAQGVAQAPAPFSRLPIEISTKIFKYTLPGPRIITIDVKICQMEDSEIKDDLALELESAQKAWEKKREDKHFREKQGLHDPKDHHMILEIERAVAIQKIPVLLHTCSLSRKVALSHYQFLSRGPKLSVCIDFNADTLHFQSRRAWELFAQKPGELNGRLLRSTMIASNSKWGYKDGDRYNINYNLFLNDLFETRYSKERDDISLETACIDEMAEKVKFLALGGGLARSWSPAWKMLLVNFWKVKKIWWRLLEYRPDDHIEDDLKQEWRKLAAGIDNEEEWLARKEEFTHITIPKTQYVSLEDIQAKQRLGEGFDIE